MLTNLILLISPFFYLSISYSIGSNTLLNFDKTEILSKINEIQTGTYKEGQIPKFWDGQATQRILEIIAKH